MSDTAAPAPRFLGLPVRSWTFGLRNWLSMMLALFVAFWLQLESASSAAVCVGILALPSRGQSFQKAVYRFLGTVIGVVASFVIMGAFNQERLPFFAATALWVALCVYVSGFLDGNRGYGAVLSGYTVAIVAIGQIDTPQMTFSAGVNRGAAEVVGILAIGFISNVFRAPDLFPDLRKRLLALQARVRPFVADALDTSSYDAAALGALLKDITALHPDITALPSEASAGPQRAAAAAAAVAAMVRELSATRAVVATLPRLGQPGQQRGATLAQTLRDGEHAVTREIHDIGYAIHPPSHDPASPDAPIDPDRLVLDCASLVLLEQSHLAATAVANVQADRYPRAEAPAKPLLPLYRSRAAARRNAYRAFLAVVIGAFILSLTGWPLTSLALVQFVATVGISATNPNPKGFAMGALVAMPLAVITAGLTEFFLLDGADSFPILAAAMLPTILFASFLIASGNQKLFGIGFLVLVFFPVILSPANPQSYDPQTYLFTSAMALTAIIMLAILLSTLLPTDDAMRRRWLMASARRDLRHVLDGHVGTSGIAAAAYRDADRLGQLAGFQGSDTDDGKLTLRRAMDMADLSLAARRIHDRLAALPKTGTPVPAARTALAALDPAGLRQAATTLLQPGDPAPRRAASELLFAASLIEAHAPDFKPGAPNPAPAP